MFIDAALIRDGAVDVAAFAAAAGAGHVVGTCACGGLMDGYVDRGRGLVWLTLVCRTCRAERTSPGGRAVTRPAGHRPAPPAWLLEAASELDARRFPDRDVA